MGRSDVPAVRGTGDHAIDEADDEGDEVRTPKEYADLAEHHAEIAELPQHPEPGPPASLAAAYATLALVAIELRNNR